MSANITSAYTIYSATTGAGSWEVQCSISGLTTAVGTLTWKCTVGGNTREGASIVKTKDAGETTADEIIRFVSSAGQAVVVTVVSSNAADTAVTVNVPIALSQSQVSFDLALQVADACSPRNRLSTFLPWSQNPIVIPLTGTQEGHVHPQVFFSVDGGYCFKMYATPYPLEADECPWLYRSADLLSGWTATGITNPLVTLGAEGAWNENYNADPCVVYSSTHSKWFMFWMGYSSSAQDAAIGMAYSSDGKTWTQYAGTAVNGNAQPVILSGGDSDGRAWESGTNGSLVVHPACIEAGGTFYLYYSDSVNGNNRGSIGLATFTWNNSTNDVESFARHSTSPILTLTADSECLSGCGHLDISYYGGKYYLLAVRQRSGRNTTLTSMSVDSVLNLWEITSLTDTTTWTDLGPVICPPVLSVSGSVPLKTIYKGGFITEPNHTITMIDGRPTMVYSAYRADTNKPCLCVAFGVGRFGSPIPTAAENAAAVRATPIDANVTQALGVAIQLVDAGDISAAVDASATGVKVTAIDTLTKEGGAGDLTEMATNGAVTRAVLSGVTAITDNGDGTSSIAYKAADGLTTVVTVTCSNTVKGSRTASVEA